MSLFQCQVCGCVENTACSSQGFKLLTEIFDWSYAPERQGLLLCSACGPVAYRDGNPNDNGGQWHGRFPRVFLPLGQFQTASNGNLEHIETGDQDYQKFAIAPDITGAGTGEFSRSDAPLTGEISRD